MNHASGKPLRIASTLAWEFWSRNRYWLLLAPLCAALIPVIVFTSLLSAHGQPSLRGLQDIDGLHVLFYWITVLSFGVSILPALATPSFRYTLPASSFVLVAAPMACAMTTVFAQYSIVALILNRLFDAGWSIWGPGLMAAVLVAWLHVVQWSTWNSVGLRILVWLASGLALVFAIVWWAISLGPQRGGFLHSIDRKLVGTFGLAALACVSAGVGGFSMLRQGSGTDVRRLVDWVRQRVALGTQVRATPFSSPQSAQFWLEWWERGYALPLGFASIGIAATLLELCLPRKFEGISLPMSFCLYLLLLISIGILLGGRSRRYAFGNFNGSRPLSDGQLATATLKSCPLGLIASAVLWVYFMTLYELILQYRHKSIIIAAIHLNGVVVVVAPFAFGLIFAWTAVGLVTSLVLAGRDAMCVGFGLAFLVASGSILVPLCLPHGYRSDFQLVYWLFWRVVFLVGCGVTYVASWRRRLISKRTLCLATLVIFTTGSLAIAFTHFTGPPIDRRSLLIGLSWWALIPIPLAAAPLAVYVNRHR